MKKIKKLSGVILAAVMAIGACSFTGFMYSGNTAEAEETEETQRTTLNIADNNRADEEKEDSPENIYEDTGESETLPDFPGETGSSEVQEDAEGTESAEIPEAEEETDSRDNQADEEMKEDEKSEGIVLGSASLLDTVTEGSGTVIAVDVSEIVENCMPSIVAVINDSASGRDDYYDTNEGEVWTSASGIIIAQNEDELLIATDSHIVSDADSLSVYFSVKADDREDLKATAKVKGSDSSYGIAVVAVQLSDIEESVISQLKIARFGSSEDIKAGQAVIVAGNYAGYGQSVTVGIISSLDFPLSANGVSMNVILTDVPVNLINRGGALLNSQGEVIGICIANDTGDYIEGMGCSVPMETAEPVLERLINKETRDKLSDSKRGYIGATVVAVSEEATSTYGMPAGAFVVDVTEGSAAEEAGIKNGDIISALEGESVSDSDELIEKMSYYAPGETITLEIQTADNGTYVARDVEVTLQAGSNYDVEEDDDDYESDEDFLYDPDDDEWYDGEWDDDEYWDEFYDFWFDDGFDDGFEEYNRQFGY